MNIDPIIWTAQERTMTRTRLIGAAALVGLLTLAACGNNSTTTKDRATIPAVTSTPSTATPTSSIANTASSEVTTAATAAPVAGTATGAGTATTAVTIKPATPLSGTATSPVDADTTKAISDADAQLSSNDQDLTDASTAAARGD